MNNAISGEIVRSQSELAFVLADRGGKLRTCSLCIMNAMAEGETKLLGSTGGGIGLKCAVKIMSYTEI